MSSFLMCGVSTAARASIKELSICTLKKEEKSRNVPPSQPSQRIWPSNDIPFYIKKLKSCLHMKGKWRGVLFSSATLHTSQSILLFKTQWTDFNVILYMWSAMLVEDELKIILIFLFFYLRYMHFNGPSPWRNTETHA